MSLIALGGASGMRHPDGSGNNLKKTFRFKVLRGYARQPERSKIAQTTARLEKYLTCAVWTCCTEYRPTLADFTFEVQKLGENSGLPTINGRKKSDQIYALKHPINCEK